MDIKIGDYKLIDKVGTLNHRTIYRFKCIICGHEKFMQLAEFKRVKNMHSYKNCREDFYQHLKGAKFGDYIVLSSSKGLHKLKCSICGFEKEVLSSTLYHKIGLCHQYCGNFIKDKYYNKLHSIWTSLRTRTNNKNCIAYKDYGERGIDSDDFKYFVDFYKYALPLLMEAEKEFKTFNLSIDRIDNDKGYSVGNIRFVTMHIQNRNRRSNKRCIATSPTGEKYYITVIRDFANQHNLCSSCITLCLKGRQSKHKGWTFCYAEEFGLIK